MIETQEGNSINTLEQEQLKSSSIQIKPSACSTIKSTSWGNWPCTALPSDPLPLTVPSCYRPGHSRGASKESIFSWFNLFSVSLLVPPLIASLGFICRLQQTVYCSSGYYDFLVVCCYGILLLIINNKDWMLIMTFVCACLYLRLLFNQLCNLVCIS